MWTFVEAATSFPTHLFTAALVVVASFWLLVAVGAADYAGFDEDVNADAWGFKGMPVAVAFSLLTAFAWIGSLCATLLLDPVAASWPMSALSGAVVLLAAPLLAWRLTCVLARFLHRRRHGEPGQPELPPSVGTAGDERTSPADTPPRGAFSSFRQLPRVPLSRP
ncbi:hypothetical protein [Streptomyces sp. NBC_01217]|uniref:hypothetical protein n=1 Tax=Streptomyces sp. NBC_01217 TaxID=2903779 RepID=UPI002E0E59F2|nr:hypothetical protein OG507_18395 [Streptomyces sp. NBC_01217]